MAKIAILLCLAAVFVAVLTQTDLQEITRPNPQNAIRRPDIDPAGRLGTFNNHHRRAQMRRFLGHRAQGTGDNRRHGRWFTEEESRGHGHRGAHGMHGMQGMQGMQGMRDAPEEVGRRLSNHQMIEALRAALMPHRVQGHRRQRPGYSRGQSRRFHFPDVRTAYDVNGRRPERGSHHRVSVLSQEGGHRRPGYRHHGNNLRGYGRLGRRHRVMDMGYGGGHRGQGLRPRYGAL